eukprot:TRINITY_DN5007_c0_g1_i1.p1 TRINITY_DN5007_c0_g1~~TRINITY_DN5007_c0_g1_i1.p1  ORF type:complete len:211 (-),score=26.79 TRINITY_DN5007_c0_g1_i1:9-641(-)
MKVRAKYLGHTIKIAHELLQINSFNISMTIYLALNFGNIVRLTQTWKLLKSKTVSMWKSISFTLNPRNNFMAYRERESQVPHEPMIPCQEVFLKDILYYSECEGILVDGFIDMKKLNKLGYIINNIWKTQKRKYSFLPYFELQQYLKENVSQEWTMEHLDDLSHHIETSKDLKLVQMNRGHTRKFEDHIIPRFFRKTKSKGSLPSKANTE